MLHSHNSLFGGKHKHNTNTARSTKELRTLEDAEPSVMGFMETPGEKEVYGGLVTGVWMTLSNVNLSWELLH